MRPNRNINDECPSSAKNHLMFLRRLSSLGSSSFPGSRPGPRGASSTSAPQLIPGPHPWWSAQGFPPWPQRLPHTRPTTRQVFTGRTLHPRNIHHGNFSGSWRSFFIHACLLMEWSSTDRGPPHKRMKSEEEKRSEEEQGGAATRGSKREHRHLDASADNRPRPNRHFRDGGQDRGNNGAGQGMRRENSRDKDGEQIKSVNKGVSSRDGFINQRWSKHQHEGHKDSQPAASRTQSPKTKPGLVPVPTHKPRPNPWFTVRGAEEQGGHHRTTTQLPDLWQVAGATREPPPPGTRPQGGAAPGKPLHRHWDPSPAGRTRLQPPGGSAAFDFSVMSYNILSQELLRDNDYLYRHCDPTVLPWEYRLPNLLTEIQQLDPDILCLQEVQEDHYENQIKPALQRLGYQCEYKKRTGSKPDGCAIVFKSSRLSLLSSNPIEFFRPGDALLDRDNVGLVLLLRPNHALDQSDPSTFICVANTHLLYNPRRGDIKLAQLAILLAEISRLSRLPDGSTNPIVLCGDFNSTPWSPLYSFLTMGSLDYRGLQISMVSGQETVPRGQRFLTPPIWSDSLGINQQCQYENKPTSPTVEGAISNLTVEDLANKAAVAFNRAKIEHSLKLQSSYQHLLLPDGRPEITTCHSRTAITVDYILFTPDSPSLPSGPSSRGLQLLSRLSLVGQSELQEVNGLPNQHHSSDHLPLLARFRLRR